MSLIPFARRLRLSHSRALILGGVLMTLSLMLVVDLSRSIQHMRDVSIPLASQIPIFEKRKNILREQIDVAQLHAALQGGSQEEFIHMYILPSSPDLDRVLGIFDIFGDYLQQEGYATRLSPIHVGDVFTGDDTQIHPLSFSWDLTENGVRLLQSLMDVTGVLSVSDVLMDTEIEQLLSASEKENPAGVISLEGFLSADLLRYARDSRSYEDQLRRSFTSPVFTNAFENILQNSRLRDIKMFLGGEVGQLLESNDMWPLRFMSLENAHIQHARTDLFTVEMTVYAHSRK
jgi:hypothetical protein